MYSCQSGRPGPNGLRALSGRAKKPGWKTGLKYATRARPYTGRGLNGPARIKNYIFFYKKKYYKILL